MADIPTAGLTDQMARESTITTNVGQQLIAVTKDRLELCLIHHRERLESRQRWLLPLGILVPIVLALLTADFKDGLGIRASTWQAVFLLLAAVSTIWTLIWGLPAARSAWTRTMGPFDAIIAELTAPRRGSDTGSQISDNQ
jgi:hypothetical protein